jgi:hypothetical protein
MTSSTRLSRAPHEYVVISKLLLIINPEIYLRTAYDDCREMGEMLRADTPEATRTWESIACGAQQHSTPLFSLKQTAGDRLELAGPDTNLRKRERYSILTAAQVWHETLKALILSVSLCARLTTIVISSRRMPSCSMALLILQSGMAPIAPFIL